MIGDDFARIALAPASKGLNTLRRQFSSPVTLQLDANVPAGTVQLIVGSSYTALESQTARKESARQQLRSLTASNGGITGTATCKNYRSIF